MEYYKPIYVSVLETFDKMDNFSENTPDKSDIWETETLSSPCPWLLKRLNLSSEAFQQRKPPD